MRSGGAWQRVPVGVSRSEAERVKGHATVVVIVVMRDLEAQLKETRGQPQATKQQRCARSRHSGGSRQRNNSAQRRRCGRGAVRGQAAVGRQRREQHLETKRQRTRGVQRVGLHNDNDSGANESTRGVGSSQ